MIFEYSISPDYLSNWGYKEALREIYQNFIDFGTYKVIDKNGCITIFNDYKPTSFEFLKIGFSKKDNENAIGKHGEGIKMALHVLCRLELDCKIECNINDKSYLLRPFFQEKEHFGKSFAIDAYKYDIRTVNSFSVSFVKTDEYDDFIENYLLKETDIEYSCNYGEIVNKKAGNIYVGGIYVTNKEELKKSFNFKPSLINLGRDRDIPNNFDVEYYTSKIVEQYLNSKNLSINDCLNEFSQRELHYVEKVAFNDIDKVTPKLFSGQIRYMYDNNILNNSALKIVENDEVIKQKVKKLKVELVKRKTPFDLINKFSNNYRYSLCSNGRSDLDIIMEKSKNWD